MSDTQTIVAIRPDGSCLWTIADRESNQVDWSSLTATPKLADLAGRMARTGGTVIYPPVLEDYRREDHHAALRGLLGSAWTVRPSESDWYTAIRADGARITIGYRHRDHPDPMLRGSGMDVSVNLAQWFMLTGHPYSHTPGHAATVTLLPAIRNRVRLNIGNPATGEKFVLPGINDIKWPGPRHGAGPAHRWDMRAAYLAAAAAVTLPTVRLDNTGPQYGNRQVGCFRVRFTGEHAGLWTPMLGRPDRQGTHWVCHPTLQALLNNSNTQAEVIDSWTAPADKTARVLRSWAEQWRDHIQTPDLDPTIQATLKLGYAQAIGLMANTRGALYRPDWRYMILDQARASLLRRIMHVYYLSGGELPMRIDCDSIWYSTQAYWSDAHEENPLGVGHHIGNMRYEGIEVL